MLLIKSSSLFFDNLFPPWSTMGVPCVFVGVFAWVCVCAQRARVCVCACGVRMTVCVVCAWCVRCGVCVVVCALWLFVVWV